MPYLSRFLQKIIRLYSRRTDPDGYWSQLDQWFKANGDKILRLDYDLDKTSIVFDLGGYEGQWTSDIFAMYRCSVYVFEPVSLFADNIERRFSKNPDIHLFHFGLAPDDRQEDIYLAADGTSLFRKTGQPERIALKNASTFFNEHNIQCIDLLKINIEGGEFDLLQYLLEIGWTNNIVNIQVQFHKFMPNAKARREAIQNQLSKTHSLTYQYPFIWENWKRNH